MPNKPLLTTEKFIENARAVHGDKYDYSRTIYTGGNNYVELICKVHGVFEIKAIYHTSCGNGCRKCGREATNRAVRDKKVYPLEKVRALISTYPNISCPNLDLEYVDSTSDLSLVCSKHGEFTKTLMLLKLNKYGCTACSYESTGKSRRRDLKELRLEIEKIYEGKGYTVLPFEQHYTSNKDNIEIDCSKHGIFKVRTNDILTKSSGCPKCKGDEFSERVGHDFDSFLELAQKKFPGMYTYCRDSFPVGDNKSKMKVTCGNHGDFYQTVADHLGRTKVGCPRCANTSSFQEEMVSKWLDEWGITYKKRSRKTVPKYEIDIFIPSRGIAIELNGVYWHSTEYKKKHYHIDKRLATEGAGFSLVQIWEDELLEIPEKIKHLLKNRLGIDQVKINARDCKVETVEKKVAMGFIAQNHIQGSGASCGKYFGMYLDGTLVAVAAIKGSFGSGKNLELHRVAYLSGHAIRGGLGKLMAAISKEFPNRQIVSYVDRDKFSGVSYYKSGFQKTTTSLLLWYVKGRKRFSRHLYKKSKLVTLPSYDVSKTEKDILEKSGIFQAWNSGVDRVVYQTNS